MRLDSVIWAKSKLSAVVGFLSNEGDTVIFTRYKKGYTGRTHALRTRQQLGADRLVGKIVGIFFPEKELFRFNRKDITDMNFTVSEGGQTMGYTYAPTGVAQFKAGGVAYQFNYAQPDGGSAQDLGTLLGVAAAN